MRVKKAGAKGVKVIEYEQEFRVDDIRADSVVSIQGIKTIRRDS